MCCCIDPGQYREVLYVSPVPSTGREMPHLSLEDGGFLMSHSPDLYLVMDSVFPVYSYCEGSDVMTVTDFLLSPC